MRSAGNNTISLYCPQGTVSSLLRSPPYSAFTERLLTVPVSALFLLEHLRLSRDSSLHDVNELLPRHLAYAERHASNPPALATDSCLLLADFLFTALLPAAAFGNVETRSIIEANRKLLHGKVQRDCSMQHAGVAQSKTLSSGERYDWQRCLTD